MAYAEIGQLKAFGFFISKFSNLMDYDYLDNYPVGLAIRRLSGGTSKENFRVQTKDSFVGLGAAICNNRFKNDSFVLGEPIFTEIILVIHSRF